MFKLEIETDNDAFKTDLRNEVARILNIAASGFCHSYANSGNLRDINGNTVGRWEFTP